MPEYMKLLEISRLSSLSVHTLKKHKAEIGYYQPNGKGPILMRWADFQAWMDRSKVELREDPMVRTILEELAAVV